MKIITATRLRNDIFKLLDEVLRTKQPLIVKRKGQNIRIEAEQKSSPTESLFSKPPRTKAVIGDSEELVNLKAWKWSESE